MRVLEQIPTMPDEKLRRVEENAKRNPTFPGAQEVIARIDADWATRERRAAEEKAEHAKKDDGKKKDRRKHRKPGEPGGNP